MRVQELTLTEDERKGSLLCKGDESVSGGLLELDVAEFLGEVTDSDGDAGL
jgi:hypothetical protein